MCEYLLRLSNSPKWKTVKSVLNVATNSDAAFCHATLLLVGKSYANLKTTELLLDY